MSGRLELSQESISLTTSAFTTAPGKIPNQRLNKTIFNHVDMVDQATAGFSDIWVLKDSWISRFAQSLQRPQQVATLSWLCRHSSEHAPLSRAFLISLSVTLLQTQTYIDIHSIYQSSKDNSANESDYQ